MRATLRSSMLKLIRLWLLQLFVLLVSTSLPAQDFPSAVVQLATRISQGTPASSASINLRDVSSIGPANASTVRNELIRELQARGWKMQETGQAETSIAITLAENYREYVWTAEISKAGARQVAMVEFARSLAATQPGNQLALTRTLLIASEQPLLDTSLLEGKISEGAHLVGLTPTAIRVYQLQSSQWRLVQEYQFNRTFPTRDLRGLLVLNNGGAFDAYLPGTHCTGTISSALSVNCVESDDPWPVNDDRRMLAFYAANRNYFNGVISGAGGQSVVNPFYSAAVLNNTVIFSGVDGHTLVAQNGHRPIALSSDWGNNIAAIQSACQSDLVLASGARDFNQSDTVTAFRTTNSEFSPASDPLPFAGPVVNLRTTADRQQAIAISTSSGRYEAYLLTPRCGA